MILAACVLSLALGADAYHDPGKFMAEARVQCEQVSVYVATDRTVGLDVLVRDGRFRVHFGIETASRQPLMSTLFGYAIRLEYPMGEDWSWGIRHRSNCKGICKGPLLPFAFGDEDDHNSGYNYLYLRRNF